MTSAGSDPCCFFCPAVLMLLLHHVPREKDKDRAGSATTPAAALSLVLQAEAFHNCFLTLHDSIMLSVCLIHSRCGNTQ